jgi:pimeloyl-ACP methyl ester carboxylesterase
MLCRVAGGVFLIALVLLSPRLVGDARADTVIMKNGMVYRGQGTPDRDNTLVFIWDGLKRIVVRDSKVEKVLPDNSIRPGEVFQLVQPMTKHGGLMPKDLLNVEAGPWNDRGRRSFRFVGSRNGKPESMEQAIIEIGTRITKFRGVDGFWQGQIDTNQVPRPVITGLLGRIERQNGTERERVVRFLMDAGWYPEARQALDALIKDFPKSDVSERAASARAYIIQAEATQRRSDADLARQAQQFQRVAELFKSLSAREVPTELKVEVREIERRDQQQRAADQALEADLRKLAAGLPARARDFWTAPLAEVVKALQDAPDAVRDRFAAWQKTVGTSGVNDQTRFALAMSGYVAGQEFAVSDLTGAENLWKARDLVHDYLVSVDDADRGEINSRLEAIDWQTAAPAPAGTLDMIRRLEVLSRVLQQSRPQRHDADTKPGTTIAHRVKLNEEDEPTDYLVRVPPEYHPLRTYPAVVVLHSGRGPQSAIDMWAAEAARRGFILIAPEYIGTGQPREYQYSTSEHAAVEIAIRDARARYAIDSDRVFLAGMLTGGNMAWDYGLAHPDSLAGIAVFSGLPARFVPRYMPYRSQLPMFFVIGDLAPAANEIVFAKYIKPYILKAWDVTYLNYYRRGLEEFPEEVPTALDWMSRHRREPFPKEFKTSTARSSDNRFYGVVIKEFAPDSIEAPKLDDFLGESLNPATIEMKSSSLSNLIRLDVKGVEKLDVWLSPKLIDFKRRPDIRVNGRSYVTRQTKIKLDMATMLDDVRVRGDRQQLYWYRVTAQLGSRSRR